MLPIRFFVFSLRFSIVCPSFPSSSSLLCLSVPVSSSPCLLVPLSPLLRFLVSGVLPPECLLCCLFTHRLLTTIIVPIVSHLRQDPGKELSRDQRSSSAPSRLRGGVREDTGRTSTCPAQRRSPHTLIFLHVSPASHEPLKILHEYFPSLKLDASADVGAQSFALGSCVITCAVLVTFACHQH